MKILKDRRNQVWEWLSGPVERFYIMESRVGEHPADGMPITVHRMLSLDTGHVVDDYVESIEFEKLAEGNDPEMQRLL